MLFLGLREYLDQKLRVLPSQEARQLELGCLPFNILFTFWAFILDDPQTDSSKEPENRPDEARQDFGGTHLVAQVRREHCENGGADNSY